MNDSTQRPVQNIFSENKDPFKGSNRRSSEKVAPPSEALHKIYEDIARKVVFDQLPKRKSAPDASEPS